jgi:parallel beta-helix repeat protein
MNKNTILTLIVLVFLSAWLNSAPIYASFSKAPDGYSKSIIANSNTILVPDNYPTIQKAIDAAEEGETILVKAGTYREHVVVNKALSLVGENKHDTIIDGSGIGTVVRLATNNITLSNFTIQNGELGIWFLRSSNSILTGNIASNNHYGIYLYSSSNNVLTGNIASNNHYGIYLFHSDNNVLTGNNVSSNNPYGFYLSYSSNNVLTGNNVSSNNPYGFYLSYSSNNVLNSNIALNNSYGIHIHSSGDNVLTGNNVSSNNPYGIHLYHSDNNVLSINYASNNQYGIYVGDSDNNVLSINYASNNQYGIHLYYSRDNTLTGNTASNNSYGLYLQGSNNNAIFHNNFISNTEPSSSIDSINYWDNGAEGNHWSSYTGTDTNRDGIGDTPYTVDENIQDNYPLMAIFLQFNVTTENQSYEIGAVCNSTISNFQCHYDPDNRTNTLSFKATGTEGKGFCRICIPSALIEPPHTVTVNYEPPLYFKTVYTNGTHTWLYFTYDPSEHEVTIMHMPYPEQLVFSQWAILGLTVTVVILLLISIKYYRMFNQQKKVIQAYEHELGNFPVSHPERARKRFIEDIVERKEKIEKFEKKYGIKIKSAKTFEELIKKLGVEKEVKN